MIKPGVLCDLVPLWICFSLTHLSLSCPGFEKQEIDFFTAVSQLLIESLKAFKTETHPSPNIPSLQIIQLTSRRS